MPNSDDGSAGDPLATLRSWRRRSALALSVVLLLAGLLADRSLLVPGLAFLAIWLVDVWWHSPIQPLAAPIEPHVNVEVASGDLPDGQLELHRRIGTAMLRRPFEIVIDGEPVQDLTRGQSFTVQLGAGRHVVQARLGTYTSQECVVQIRPSSVSRVEVWGSMLSMRRAMQDPTRTIDIVEVAPTETAQ